MIISTEQRNSQASSMHKSGTSTQSQRTNQFWDSRPGKLIIAFACLALIPAIYLAGILIKGFIGG